MSSNFEDEFDQIFEMEAEEFSYVVVQNGKKTLLRLGLNIEDRIENYLKDSGLLDELDSLKEQIDELSDKLKELEENGFGQKLQILVNVEDGADVTITGPDFSENITSSGGQALFLPEHLGVYTIVSTSNGKTSTKTVTATEKMTYTVTVDFQTATIKLTGNNNTTVTYTSPSGVVSSVRLYEYGVEPVSSTITVEDLGTYSFVAVIGSDMEEFQLEVSHYITYTLNVYVYEKLVLSDCSWADIKKYADDNTAKYRFGVGDTKDITTADGVRTVAIMEFGHTSFKYQDDTTCRIVFGATQLGYRTYSRTSHTPTYDDFAVEMGKIYDGFSDDLKAVVDYTYTNGLSVRTFAFTEMQVSTTTYFTTNLDYYHGKSTTFRVKRTNNGEGVAAIYWLMDGDGFNNTISGNTITASGTSSTSAIDSQHYEIFGFCL